MFKFGSEKSLYIGSVAPFIVTGEGHRTIQNGTKIPIHQCGNFIHILYHDEAYCLLFSPERDRAFIDRELEKLGEIGRCLAAEIHHLGEINNVSLQEIQDKNRGVTFLLDAPICVFWTSVRIGKALQAPDALSDV